MNMEVPCICPHDLRSLGRLDGVSMGKGMVRLETTAGCLRHDPKSHPFVPHVVRDWCVNGCRDMCHQCNHKQKDHSKP